MAKIPELFIAGLTHWVALARERGGDPELATFFTELSQNVRALWAGDPGALPRLKALLARSELLADAPAGA